MDEQTFEKVGQVILLPYRDKDKQDLDNETRETIRELAKDFRTHRLYEKAYKDRKDGITSIWYADTPQNIHADMLAKMAAAPFPVLAQSVAIMMIPILDDRLDGKTEMTPPTEAKQDREEQNNE